VDSDPGSGSTFCFYLPAQPGADIQEPEVETPGPVKGGRVLVVNDDRTLGRVLSRMLSSLGCQVHVVADGIEALNVYRGAMGGIDRFSAVITDLTMPGGKSGDELARDLLAADPGARIIISSGYAQAPAMTNHQAYGFVGSLVKPYTMEQLQSLLATVLSPQS
jgi:two-component system cell cycle sensor histidine kinase/response regulator CckA